MKMTRQDWVKVLENRAKVIVPGMSAVFCCAIPAVSAPKHGACPLQCL